MLSMKVMCKLLLLFLYFSGSLSYGQDTPNTESLQKTETSDLIIARLIEIVNSDSIKESHVYNESAAILSNNRYYHEAMKGFNKAIKLDKNEHQYWYNRALLKEKLEDYRGAIEDFTQAIKLNPNDGDIFEARAQCFIRLNKLEQARDDLNSAVNAGLESADVYMNRGICKYQLGDKEGGCKDFSKAGELGHTKAYEAIKQFCK